MVHKRTLYNKNAYLVDFVVSKYLCFNMHSFIVKKYIKSALGATLCRFFLWPISTTISQYLSMWIYFLNPWTRRKKTSNQFFHIYFYFFHKIKNKICMLKKPPNMPPKRFSWTFVVCSYYMDANIEKNDWTFLCISTHE